MLNLLNVKNINKWFWLGFLAVVLGAPNGTVIRFTISDFDPIYFNFLRFSLIFLVTLPYIIINRSKLNKSGLKYTAYSGITFAVAVFCFVEAINSSQASYASLIGLASPIFFITYSVKLNNESISRKSAAGITLAALGAFIMIFMPLAAKGGSLSGQFYPLATILMLLNCVSYPLGTIYVKKANDEGIPMVTIIGLSALIISLSSLLILPITHPSATKLDWKVLIAVLFSGLIVGVVHRIAAIKSYEHVGSVVSSALGYFGSFLSILIPVFVLGEKLSLAMVAGGVLILLGIYIIEHHKSEHHKRFHAFRHH
jgi:drug/metabolite transporter (DMT)-like permease